MITPPLPSNEAERLAELTRFDILDTLPEEAYDAITLLASHICDTPIALISIIDKGRQWFKSRIGIDATETTRDLAFCAHAILDPGSLLIVPDATQDPRFARHPLVTGDPAIRFYAGAPLVTSTGHALGTLCVIDRTPRTLTTSQAEALAALSVQVMALLELRWTISELHRQQEELNDVVRQRETFIAAVSHEIRTPLSAVVGYIGLLTDPTTKMSEAERAETMTTVGQQAGDVSQLIDDLLVAAKAESGSLRVQSVEVNLAAQIAQVLEGLDPVPGVAMNVEGDRCRALGDPGRVRQVIRNLVTNAFRYGGPNVTLTVRYEGDRCVLEVADDGDGIPDEDQERIFEPFEQASGGRKAAGSIGLGLPISRLLAARMGGALTYARRNDSSVFRFELPAAAATDAAAIDAGADGKEASAVPAAQ